eukprot:scaffold22177_cov31-Tisochrysis_lutea.AAC.4
MALLPRSLRGCEMQWLTRAAPTSGWAASGRSSSCAPHLRYTKNENGPCGYSRRALKLQASHR